MGDLFYQLGRRLGQAAVPAAQKTKWAWRLLAGTDEESIQAEAEMGAAMAREVPMAQSYALPSDAPLLADICRELTGRLRNKDRVFHLHPVNTGGPNAFSLPGGFLFVDIALLEVSRRDRDMLAFALGHEIAHVVQRHALHRWVTGVGINMLALLVSRGGLGAWWQQNGRELLRSAYNRDQEREADEFGFRLARAAGYDPSGARRLLTLLQQLRGLPGGLGEHYASHPVEGERLASLEEVERKVVRRLAT